MTRPTRRPLPEQPPESPDRAHFVLKDEDWRAFVELLDRPERDMSGLTEFLARPSILDQADDVANGDGE